MADLSAYAGSTNPWEWQQWAATQDPGLYGWQDARQVTATDLPRLKASLQAAGQWNPAWDAYSGFLDADEKARSDYFNAMGPYGSGYVSNLTDPGAPDLSALDGYKMASARSINNTMVNGVFDSQGRLLGGDTSLEDKSLKSGDYAQIASILAMGMGGPAGIGEMLGAGTGTMGTVAGGAAIGGTLGGINANGNDESIWKGILTGALKGGAMAGAGSLASDYFSGWQPTDGGPLQAGTPIDTTALDQARAWQPTALGSAETMVGQLPAMSGGLGSIMDLSSGLPVDQIVTTGSRAALAGGQVGAMNPSLPSLPPISANVPSMSLPNLQFDMPQIAETPTVNTGLGSLGSLPELPAAVENLPPTPAPITTPALAATPTLLPAIPGGNPVSNIVNGSAGVSDYLKVGGLVAGALTGAQGTPGQTATSQSRTDPRFDPYLYGSGGLLESAKGWFNANKTPNAAQQAGWNQQIGLLTDPNISNQLTQMRNQGAGLLGQQVAANPFTNGGLLGGGAPISYGPKTQEMPQVAQMPQQDAALGTQAFGPDGNVWRGPAQQAQNPMPPQSAFPGSPQGTGGTGGTPMQNLWASNPGAVSAPGERSGSNMPQFPLQQDVPMGTQAFGPDGNVWRGQTQPTQPTQQPVFSLGGTISDEDWQQMDPRRIPKPGGGTQLPIDMRW